MANGDDENPGTPPRRAEHGGGASNPAEPSHVPHPYPPIAIGASFSEAWQLVGGSKATYHSALLIVFVITMALAVAQLITLELTGLQDDFIANVIWGVASQAASVTLGTGMMLIGIRRMCGRSISPSMVFWPVPEVIPLLWTTFLAILLVIVDLLFVLPGLYLLLAYWFAAPLVVDRGLRGWEALERSREAISAHWFHYFFVVILVTVIIFLSALPLGLGLIWSLPWVYNLTGVLYRNAFGIGKIGEIS